MVNTGIFVFLCIIHFKIALLAPTFEFHLSRRLNILFVFVCTGCKRESVNPRT